jgi:predicted secreted protein
MATSAKIGYGCLFSLGDVNSPQAYTPLAEITNISPPTLARDAVDATHSQSPEGWRDFIPGLKDGGEVTVEMNFIPSGDSTDRLIAAFNSDNLLNCKIAFNDSPATEWTFQAICTAFAPEGPVEDKMSASATFKVTGKPTFVS